MSWAAFLLSSLRPYLGVLSLKASCTGVCEKSGQFVVCGNVACRVMLHAVSLHPKNAPWERLEGWRPLCVRAMCVCAQSFKKNSFSNCSSLPPASHQFHQSEELCWLNYYFKKDINNEDTFLDCPRVESYGQTGRRGRIELLHLPVLIHCRWTDPSRSLGLQGILTCNDYI